MTANQAILSTRRVPGVPSATVAPAAQPSRGFRQILGELEGQSSDGAVKPVILSTPRAKPAGAEQTRQ